MKTIKGPGIFLAQFLRDEKPYNNIESISKWNLTLFIYSPQRRKECKGLHIFDFTMRSFILIRPDAILLTGK